MVAASIICAASFLLFLPLIVLYRLWWTPLHLQRTLASQGIRGPPYRFLHGNNSDMIAMNKQARSAATDLSHDIFPRLQPHLYTWINLYGSVFLSWFGTQPQIVVTDTELIREILNNKDGSYQKPKFRNYVKKLLGDGIVLAQGEKWSRLRKLANHSFHGDCLKVMIPAMVASAESMLENWKRHEGKELDVFKEFKLLTSDVISRTAFGSSYLEGRTIFDLIGKMCAMISANPFKTRSLYMRTEDDIEADRLEKLLHISIMKLVKKREDEVKTGQESIFGTDFLGSLLRALHDGDEKNRISAAEIIDECKTFYFAGQETTYSLLSWSMLVLAIHQDWQEKARQEVLEFFGQDIPNPEGITRLKTVTMVIYETLRLYSPVTNLGRRIKSKVRLGKYEFPANVNVIIPPLAIHHSPEIWGQDAHLFKPDRFGEGLAKATNGNPMAFLGFGFGPRMCVGMNFAITEAKIVLSMILQRYKFTLSPNYVHCPRIHVTIQPDQGVCILLQPLYSNPGLCSHG